MILRKLKATAVFCPQIGGGWGWNVVKDVGKRASLDAVGVLCCDMTVVPRGHLFCPSGHCLNSRLPCDKDPTPPQAVVFLLSFQALRWALSWPIFPIRHMSPRHGGGSKD